MRLFEQGLDINYSESLLHIAVSYFRVDTTRLLAEKRINVHSKNNNEQTLLAASLAVCYNADICSMAAITIYIISSSGEVTFIKFADYQDKCKEEINKIITADKSIDSKEY